MDNFFLSWTTIPHKTADLLAKLMEKLKQNCIKFLPDRLTLTRWRTFFLCCETCWMMKLSHVTLLTKLHKTFNQFKERVLCTIESIDIKLLDKDY